MSRGSRQTSSTSARQSRWALPWIVVVAAALLGGSPAPAQAADPCPSQTHFDWMGASVSTTVSIPSLVQPNGITSYDGTILMPADTAAFPGSRPVVLLQHGLGGNQCAQWWTAQDLAGHGYIAVVWTAPQGSDTVAAFLNAVDAMRSAKAFIRSPANPYAAATDGDRIALAGHSLGSVVASFVQQDPDPGVRAIVALDTLRRWVNGDPGGAVFECAAAEAGEITPRVPALGFAKDEPCTAKPDFAPADLKLPGFEHWREAGIPAMELVMAGYNHLDFASPGSESKHRDLAYFIEAWLARWVVGDRLAGNALFAEGVLGSPTAALLSTQFLSGVYIPGKIDTTDYRGYLTDEKAPNTKRISGPEGRISRDRARRGLTLRFTANDPDATFLCKLDRDGWRRCKSPERVIGPPHLRVGRHRFEVSASDVHGNDDRTPAVWKFRVVD